MNKNRWSFFVCLFIFSMITNAVYSADFMTIPNNFLARQLISASKIMANYNSLRNAIVDGTNKINVAQLFISNNLAIDSDRDATLVNGTFTGTMDLSGDLAVDSTDLFVDVSLNRVGIGTTTGNTTLQIGDGFGVFNMEVDANSNGNGYFLSRQNSVRGQWVLSTATDDTIFQMYDGSGIINSFHTGADSYITGGQFGIGTTTPNATLVVGKGDSNDSIRVNSDSNGTGYQLYRSGLLRANLVMETAGDDTLLDLYDGSGNQIQLHTGDVSFINGGNFGVGTATPEKTLSVVGDLRVTGDTTIDDLYLDKIPNNLNVSGSIVVDGGIDAGSNGVKLGTQTIALGSWDMSGGSILSVAASAVVPSVNRIIDVDLFVRDDGYGDVKNFTYGGQIQFTPASSTLWLNFSPDVGGAFDSASYNGTGFNRGTANITYVIE